MWEMWQTGLKPPCQTLCQTSLLLFTPPLPWPVLWILSSFSRTILTLSNAGCLCSALEFSRFVAVDVWIFTASVFCLVRDFLWMDWTWMSKFEMPPWLSGGKISKCLLKALDSFFPSTSRKSRKCRLSPILGRHLHLSTELADTSCEVLQLLDCQDQARSLVVHKVFHFSYLVSPTSCQC